MQAKPAKILKRSDILLRNLRKQDLDAVAAIHVAALPNNSMTMLGGETVRRYYEWQLIGPHSASAIGAFIKDKCVGFFFGGIFRGSTSGFLKENRWYLSWRVLTHPWLIRKKSFRDQARFAMHKLWSKSKLVILDNFKPSEQSFGILALNVTPEFQRQGIGRLLMQQAEAIARNHSFDGMHLTIDCDNQLAVDICERLGWQKSLEEGDWHGEMRKSLK